MPKYTTMKNAELEAILKERGLPHTGKKAEMVTRLEEDDKKKSGNLDDEIDWDDEAADTAAESAQAAPAAPITTAPGPAETETHVDGNNPQAVPNQVAAIDPSTTSDLTVQESTDPTEKGEPVKEADKVDYTMGLGSTDIDKELEARKRRMERFNMSQEDVDEAAAETLKRLERQKKFGETSLETNKIDSALSEQRRKRGREGADDRGDFKRGRGRGGRGFRSGNRGPRNDRGPRQERSGGGGGGGGGWMSAEDRAAADRRKARWNA